MVQQLVAADSQPCVWMCAGLIRYKLCERDFDCENCPLDAALHGEQISDWHGAALLNRRVGASTFPEDRLYSTCHTWTQPQPDTSGIWRVGLDAFGAALVGNVVAIRWRTARQNHERGDPICEIDVGLGSLPIGAPVRGRISRINDTLLQQPGLLVTDPYESGWIAELSVTDDADIDDLLSPTRARQQLTLDLRRFRRNVAFRLFVDVARKDVRASQTESITDLRNLIGGDQYVDRIREFIR